MLRPALFFLISYLLSCCAMTQDFRYDRFSEQEGLAGANVYDGLQDRDGFLWFTTSEGVSRFDGEHFENFGIEEGLTDNDVVGIFEDSGGRIWFETMRGIPCFMQSGKIYNPENLPLLKKINPENFIYTTYEDEKGNIWIGSRTQHFKVDFADSVVTSIEGAGASAFWTYNDTIFSISSGDFPVLNEQTGEKFSFAPSMDALGPSTPIFGSRYSEHELLVHLDKKLLRIDLRNRTVAPLTCFNAQNEARIIQTRIIGELILVATMNGCYTFHKRAEENIQRFLSHDQIRTAFIDHEENLWMLSNHGLFLLRDQSVVDIFEDRNEYSHVVAGEHELLASTPDALLRVFEPKKEKPFAGIRLKLALRKARVLDGAFFLGSDQSVVRFRDGKVELQLSGFPFKDIVLRGDTAFIFTSNNVITIPQISELQGEIDMHDLVEKKRVTRIATQRFYSAVLIEGKIYAGMRQGLFEYDDGELRALVDGEKVNSGRIVAIDLFKDQFVISTANRGAFICDKNFESVVPLSNSPLRILKTLRYKGQLLFIGKHSVYALRRKGLQELRKFSGPGAIISDATIFRGDLHLATSSGLWKITDLNDDHVTMRPKLQVAAHQGNEAIADGAELKSFENEVDFSFKGITFSKMPMRYRYKLTGVDGQWHATRENHIRYADLRPGKYEFTVQVSGADDIMRAEASIAFAVQAAWWQVWWFLLLTALLGLLMVVGISRMIIRSKQQALKRKHEIEVRLIEAEQRALRAQMNPHFIFNALNSIQNLVLQEQTDSAYKYLGAFSKLVRSILNNSRNTSIQLSEEIDFLKLYLEIESLRFRDHFRYEITNHVPSISQTRIPSMVIQPFVENAILHGLIPKENAHCLLQIEFEMQPAHLVCTIRDNGVGRAFHQAEKAASTLNTKSHALQMIRERLSLFDADNHSDFKITDLYTDGKPTGTEVTILINYESRNHRR